ncbi:MAG: flagellar hook-associated protein FlgK [Burkholderiaceae bacterium]|jgi:flagellar hook-associated protein 1 FlgK|nr:flagellar hook-associated protein FlgK [Burkholderiaceae bacterium]
MANVYSIGKSALLAANYAISVTGHNISNATTAGYNRQVILQSNAPGQRYGFGFIGDGVQLDDVRRVYDKFLGRQFINTQAESSYLDNYYNQISKINSKLADESAGVSPALQSFFSAVQEIASTPTSAATREAMLSEAIILTGRFNNLAAQLTEQRDLANAQIMNGVDLINSYAHEIAKLNGQISRAQVTESDPAPNDLLDQRDLLISKMAEEIGVRTVENGMNLDVYVGNGQPLVINNTAFPMFARYSPTDPQTVEIGYVNNGVEVIIPDKLLAGGKITANKDFLRDQVETVQNELGRIAATLSMDFNAQHKLGQDLNGDPGEDFFRLTLTASAPAASGNGSAASEIVDQKALYASNYLIEFDGASYSITRQSDGTRFSGQTLPAVIDGIEFTASGLQAGDTVLLKPLANMAAGFGLAISDPDKIAAASPVRTGKGESNQGSGVISLGEVKGAGYATSGTLKFNATTGTFETSADVWVTLPDGTTALYQPGDAVPYEEGAQYDFGNFTFTITGDPADGDTFYIEPNTGGTGDNRNMLLLAALQDAKTMVNGTATYQGAYSQLVNRVGAKTQELQVTSTSTGNMLNSIYEEQQSQSGVNLDEEAIKLMQYQQNYNAATKVIQTANEMFDTILSIF